MKRLTKNGEDNTYETLFNNVTVVNQLGMYEDANELKPLDEWNEDYGNCLFWKLPIEEPPYCGSMFDCDFINDYYTHFTILITPIKINI